MKFAVVNKLGNFLKADSSEVVNNFEFLPFYEFEENRKGIENGASMYPIFIQEFDDSDIGIAGVNDIFESAKFTFMRFPRLKDLITQKELFLVPHPHYRVVGIESGFEVIHHLLEDEKYRTVGKQLFDESI